MITNDWLKKIESRLLNYVIPRIENAIKKFDQTEVYSNDQFKWVGFLESHWEEIRDEFVEFHRTEDLIPSFHEVSPIQEWMTNDDKWKMLVLFAFGKKVSKTAGKFPRTMSHLRKVPGVKAAMFSIFEPSKHVQLHHGNVKMILRYQLGLIVPEPYKKCKININGSDYHWQNGHSLLWDNTVPHEVWNESEGTRVVLMLDVMRQLPFPLNLLNKMAYKLICRSDKIKNALVNLDET